MIIIDRVMRMGLITVMNAAALLFTAWLVMRTYDSLPAITAVSCDVYGDPIMGRRERVLEELVAPSLIGSAAAAAVLNGLSLSLNRDDKRVLYPLPLASLYIIAVMGWIDMTVILSARSLVPIYPLLVYLWILLSITGLVLGLSIYYTWLRSQRSR